MEHVVFFTYSLAQILQKENVYLISETTKSLPNSYKNCHKILTGLQ